MLGFIGCGNMAQAIIRGTIAGGIPQKDLMGFDTDAEKCRKIGIALADSVEALIEASDQVIIAVKPNIVSSVLTQNKMLLRDKAVISIAAGWSSDKLAAHLDPSTRYLRVMPNTPALVCAGMTALSRSHTLTDDEAALMERVFSAIGRIMWVEEYQMDAVIGVSGSGPAYVYMFIEALSDGGVLKGLSRAQALEMAAQTVMGAAKTALESGLHPGELKDMVCSPGGTTIEAVLTLEEDGLRAAVIRAVAASAEKADKMR